MIFRNAELLSLPERLARDSDWRATFDCADPTGATAPCAGREDIMFVPGWDDGRYQPCPIAATRQCEPWQREQARRAAQRAAQETAARVDRKIRRGIPSRFMAADLRGEQTAAITTVRPYLNEGAALGDALVMLGGVGCGKTTALCAAVDAWPRSARFLEADAIAKAAASRDHEPLHELVKSAESVSLLALDDLFRGHVKVGGLAEAVIEELLCSRHAREQATIISSNLTPRELAKRLSPRVVDRLREWATIVTLPAGSLRVRL
jgi:DNA replication protein DnaC